MEKGITYYTYKIGILYYTKIYYTYKIGRFYSAKAKEQLCMTNYRIKNFVKNS